MSSIRMQQFKEKVTEKRMTRMIITSDIKVKDKQTKQKIYQVLENLCHVKNLFDDVDINLCKLLFYCYTF